MAKPIQQQQPAAAPEEWGPHAGPTCQEAVEHRCGHVEVTTVWQEAGPRDRQKRRLRERADCGRCSAGRR